MNQQNQLINIKISDLQPKISRSLSPKLKKFPLHIQIDKQNKEDDDFDMQIVNSPLTEQQQANTYSRKDIDIQNHKIKRDQMRKLSKKMSKKLIQKPQSSHDDIIQQLQEASATCIKRNKLIDSGPEKRSHNQKHNKQHVAQNAIIDPFQIKDFGKQIVIPRKNTLIRTQENFFNSPPSAQQLKVHPLQMNMNIINSQQLQKGSPRAQSPASRQQMYLTQQDHFLPLYSLVNRAQSPLIIGQQFPTKTDKMNKNYKVPLEMKIFSPKSFPSQQQQFTWQNSKSQTFKSPKQQQILNQQQVHNYQINANTMNIVIQEQRLYHNPKNNNSKQQSKNYNFTQQPLQLTPQGLSIVKLLTAKYKGQPQNNMNHMNHNVSTRGVQQQLEDIMNGGNNNNQQNINLQKQILSQTTFFSNNSNLHSGQTNLQKPSTASSLNNKDHRKSKRKKSTKKHTQKKENQTPLNEQQTKLETKIHSEQDINVMSLREGDSTQEPSLNEKKIEEQSKNKSMMSAGNDSFIGINHQKIAQSHIKFVPYNVQSKQEQVRYQSPKKSQIIQQQQQQQQRQQFAKTFYNQNGQKYNQPINNQKTKQQNQQQQQKQGFNPNATVLSGQFYDPQAHTSSQNLKTQRKFEFLLRDTKCRAWTPNLSLEQELEQIYKKTDALIEVYNLKGGSSTSYNNDNNFDLDSL